MLARTSCMHCLDRLVTDLCLQLAPSFRCRRLHRGWQNVVVLNTDRISSALTFVALGEWIRRRPEFSLDQNDAQDAVDPRCDYEQQPDVKISTLFVREFPSGLNVSCRASPHHGLSIFYLCKMPSSGDNTSSSSRILLVPLLFFID